MRNVILFVGSCVVLAAAYSDAAAVEVYPVDGHFADVVVYVTDDKNLAECTIFVREEAALADGNAVWYWQESEAMADVSVAITDNEALAEHTIAFTDSEALADCDVDWAALGK